MRHLLSICLLGLIICCGQKPKSSSVELAEVTKDDSLEIVECVTKMYEEIFDFYNSNENVSMADFDVRFLSESLKRTYLFLEEAYSQQMKEFPGIGYDHWIQAQDWDKVSMRVNSIQFKQNPIVNITILHRGANIQHTDITLDLVLYKEDDGRWTIDDFITNGKSEKAFMQSMLNDIESNGGEDADVFVDMDEAEEFGIEKKEEQVYEYEEDNNDPLTDAEAGLVSTHQETLV